MTTPRLLLTVPLCGVILLSAFGIVHASPPPELTVLRQQYEKVVAERVTAPFDAGLAELNAKYDAGLDRAIADAKAAGKLEDILAIEAEKKRLTNKLPIPDADAESEPEALKKFRAIYREQRSTLAAARDATQAQLLTPYEAKLKDLEAVLVKNDRVDEAKDVLAYRQGLALGAPAAAAPAVSPSGPVAAPAKISYPKGDDRKAAEWALTVGGTVTLRVGGKVFEVSDAASLPRAKFEVLEIELNSPGKVPVTDLLPIAGLQSLRKLEAKDFKEINDEDLLVLRSLPALKDIRLSGCSLTDAAFAEFAELPGVEQIGVGSNPGITGTGLEALSKQKKLIHLSLLNCTGITEAGWAGLDKLTGLQHLEVDKTSFSDAQLPLLDGMKKLQEFRAKETRVTAAGIASREAFAGLGRLDLEMAPGDAASHAAALAKNCPLVWGMEITSRMASPLTKEDLAALRAFPKLKTLKLYTGAISDDSIAGICQLPNLERLMTAYAKLTDAGLPALATHKGSLSIEFGAAAITDAGLLTLTQMKGLKTLKLINCSEITPAGIAAFKKQRPDAEIVR